MLDRSVVDPATRPAPPQQVRLDGTLELKQPPAPAQTEKKRDWLPWIQAATPFILAGVGLYFTDVVRTGLERQQLQLSNVAEMREVLLTLLGSEVTQQQAQAAASTLSAFGAPAVAPLVTALVDADDLRTPAIENALRAIGLNNARAVCDPLVRILQHQSGRFSWLMHRSAIRVIGDIQCADARPLLEAYAQRLASGELKTYDPATEEWVPLTDDAAQLLKVDVERALGNTGR